MNLHILLWQFSSIPYAHRPPQSRLHMIDKPYENSRTIWSLQDDRAKTVQNMCELSITKLNAIGTSSKKNLFQNWLFFLTSHDTYRILQHSFAVRTPVAAIQFTSQILYMFHILITRYFHHCFLCFACVWSVPWTHILWHNITGKQVATCKRRHQQRVKWKTDGSLCRIISE